MATKLTEKPNAKLPKSPRRSSKSPRSLSPNNVLINGQIIDKQSSESILVPKRTWLDNILEESDQLCQDVDLQKTEPIPLEDAVKKADENVQKFIQEMTKTKRIEEDDKCFKLICQNSQEELRGLSNFLSTIDDSSKNKIVDTLINVYKTEILSGIKGNSPQYQAKPEPQDKISKFKKVCKGLIKEHHKKPTPLPRVTKNIKPIGRKPDDGSNAACQYARVDYITGNSAQLSETSGDSSYKRDDPLNRSKFERSKNIPKQSDKKRPLNLQTTFAVNYHTKQELSEDSFQPSDDSAQLSLETIDGSKLELLQLPSDMEHFSKFQNPFRTDIFRKEDSNDTVDSSNVSPTVKKIYANLPVEIRHSKEQAINRILGRAPKGPIAQTEFLVRTYSKMLPEEKHVIQHKPMSVKFYDDTKKFNEDPRFFDIKQFVSEGIQASLSQKYYKTKKHPKYHQLNYLKPYRYRYDSSYESQSDVAIKCPFGCDLKLKKSKSDTDIEQIKALKKKQRKNKEKKRQKEKQASAIKAAMQEKQEKPSLIEVSKKSSLELIRANEIRRKKKLINYLDKSLKTGDSEYQFSQILFEKPNRNVDNEVSCLEIPVMDHTQVDHFNANYLLHSLKIQQSNKTDIIASKTPVQYFVNDASDLNVTEEEYKKWLRKRNWGKYSNVAQELKSFEELRSVSQTMPPCPTKEKCGEYGYYLDRGDHNSKTSNMEYATTVISEFGETFLYEHVVVSRAINFFSSFNAQRTRTLNKWDRGVQVLFFGLFYFIWTYFSKYVFVDSASKKGTLLWK